MASGDPYNREGRRAPTVPSAQKMPVVTGKTGGLGGRPIGHGAQTQPPSGPGKYDASARSSYDSVNRMREKREAHNKSIRKIGYGSSPRQNSISSKIGDRGKEVASYDGDDAKKTKPTPKPTPEPHIDVTVATPAPHPTPTPAGPNGTPGGILGLMHAIHDKATAPIVAQPMRDKNEAAYKQATGEDYDGHVCDGECRHSHDGEDGDDGDDAKKSSSRDGDDAKGRRARNEAKKGKNKPAPHGGAPGGGAPVGAGGPPGAPPPPSAAPVGGPVGMIPPGPSGLPPIPSPAGHPGPLGLDGEDARGPVQHEGVNNAGAGPVAATKPAAAPPMQGSDPGFLGPPGSFVGHFGGGPVPSVTGPLARPPIPNQTPAPPVGMAPSRMAPTTPTPTAPAGYQRQGPSAAMNPNLRPPAPGLKPPTTAATPGAWNPMPHQAQGLDGEDAKHLKVGAPVGPAPRIRPELAGGPVQPMGGAPALRRFRMGHPNATDAEAKCDGEDGDDGIHIKPSHKGLLHKKLGVPQGEKIPKGEIAAAKNSSSPSLRKEATFAQNFGHDGEDGD